jgi:hypothetical protein
MRPHRNATPEGLAEWAGRTFSTSLRVDASEASLDELVSVNVLGDPDEARATIAVLRASGRL